MNRLHAIFLALACAGLPALAAADEKQACNSTLMAQALEKPLQGKISLRSDEQQGDVMAWACKPHPENRKLVIAALLYDVENPGLQNQLGFAMAVIDTRTQQVKHLYRETLEQDANTRVDEHSLTLDTGRYKLGPGIRALGLRINITYKQACSDDGFSNFLTLFVEDGPRLKPVLKNLAISRSKAQGSSYPCAYNPQVFTQDIAELTLAVEPTSTLGFNDLTVTARIQRKTTTMNSGDTTTSPQVKRISGTLRFDGQRYPTEEWEAMLERQWLFLTRFN